MVDQDTEAPRAADDDAVDVTGVESVEPPEAVVRRVRRGVGERARKRREERRARRRQLVVRLLQATVLLGLAIVLIPLAAQQLATWRGDDAPAEDATTEPSEAPAADAGLDPRPIVLVATYDDAGESVTRIQLLSLDAEAGRGAVVLVPTTMVADVPGYGLLPIGDAGTFGGPPLLELTIENQLGVAVDATVKVTEQDWAALFSRTGGFEVEVARSITTTTADGPAERRFEPGLQFLDGPRLAELLTIEVADEDELTSFARVRQVLEGFLATAAQEGALDRVFDDGAPMLTVSDLDVVERTLRGLATEEAGELVALRTLPVTALGSGDDVFYRLDDARAGEFVADVLGGEEAIEAATGVGLKLEILNGNGQAGIGADVAALLVPLGHTVAITRNAETFDNPATRILLYGDDDELVAAAQEIADILGVGRIEVSDVPSSIVDITVLVGRDFRR